MDYHVRLLCNDLAWANSEYVTHYLNLAYTPAKAISMKIAAEVTHSVPLNKQYAAYPNDTNSNRSGKL
jgi:hypothetical protein